MQGSFSVWSKLYRILYIGIIKAANTLFQQKRGDLYFAEKCVVKPKSGAKRRKKPGFCSISSVLQTLIVFKRISRTSPFGGVLFYYAISMYPKRFTVSGTTNHPLCG